MQYHTGSMNITPEQLQQLRIQLANSSPLAEALSRCASWITLEDLPEVCYAITQVLRLGAGLTTLSSAARLLQGLASRQEFIQPLKGFTKPIIQTMFAAIGHSYTAATLRRLYSDTIGYLAAASTGKTLDFIVEQIHRMYTGSVADTKPGTSSDTAPDSLNASDETATTSLESTETSRRMAGRVCYCVALRAIAHLEVCLSSSDRSCVLFCSCPVLCRWREYRPAILMISSHWIPSSAVPEDPKLGCLSLHRIMGCISGRLLGMERCMERTVPGESEDGGWCALDSDPAGGSEIDRRQELGSEEVLAPRDQETEWTGGRCLQQPGEDDLTPSAEGQWTLQLDQCCFFLSVFSKHKSACLYALWRMCPGTNRCFQGDSGKGRKSYSQRSSQS